jgi:Flp pilus assembly protein TadG
MKSLLKNTRGSTMVEFALVALPILGFMVGLMQTAWVVWADNLLHVSVDTAARCGAVPTSTTIPCYGNTLQDMQQTANLVFQPLSGATFSSNTTCANDNGAGLIGTYNVSFLLVLNLKLTAKSCYPTV